MKKLLINHFWVLNLFVLLLIAYFLASGVGEITASKIQESLPKGTQIVKATPPPRRAKPLTSRIPNGDSVLERNFFDSETGSISRIPEPIEDDILPEETHETIDGLPIVPCTSSGPKLLATVASKEDIYWSFASVQEGGKTKLYRVGDELNNRTVSGITWRYMFLRGTVDECYMDMFADPNAPPPQAPKVAKKAAANSPGTGTVGPTDYSDRITKVSETERIIDRSLVNELLSDPTKFIRTVRVRPYRKGGKTVGYKLRRFRSSSPLAALGAQKGDIIHSVNGADLTSVDKALGVYQKMRSADELTFSVTRKGKPVDLRVSIR